MVLTLTFMAYGIF